MQTRSAETARSPRRVHYQGAAAITVVMILLMLGQIVYFSLAPSPEGGARSWFSLFAWNELFGLLSYELPMVLYALLSIPVMLVLFVALRESSRPLAWGFLVLGVSSALAFVLSRPMWDMLALSRQFAAATTPEQALELLAAGNRLITGFNGPLFQFSYLASALGGVLLGVAMLRQPVFGKALPRLCIASALLDLGSYLPGVGFVLSLLSVLLLLAFNILLVRALLRLGRAAALPEAG